MAALCVLSHGKFGTMPKKNLGKAFDLDTQWPIYMTVNRLYIF